MGAAAAATTAALGVIVRTTAQSAAQIQQFAQVANATPEVFQRWSAASARVGIAQEKLADILKDVNDRVGDFLQTGGGPMADFFETIAPRVGVTAEQFARLSGPEALQLYVTSLERAGLSQQEMTFYLEAMASDATRLIPLLANGGAEMARLGARAAGLGTVLDREALAALRRTEIALIGVGQVFQGMRVQIGAALAPAVTAMADAFLRLAETGGPINRAVTGVLDNLTRLGTYAATFAAFLAGRWVAAMAAAALSVRGLATALVVLRGALIRTGIGALIVGAGELFYQFTRLVAGAGGFGEAMSLLKDLAVEVWDRIRMGAAAAGAAATAMFHDLQADAASGVAGAIESVVAFGNTTANTFEGAVLAVREIWSRLPDVIGDLVYSAANRMLDGVEAMLNGAIRRIDKFTGKIRDALAAVGIETTFGRIGEISLGGLANPFAGASADAGTAAEAAFRRAFEDNPLTAPELGLDAIMAEALETANIYRTAAGDLAAGAAAPLNSWSALREAVAGAGDDGSAALDAATASADRFDDALEDTEDQAGRAGGAARQTGEDAAAGAEAARAGWQSVVDTLADYARQSRDIAGDVGSALVGAFRNAESAIGAFVKTGKLDFRDLVTSMLADLAQLAARRFLLGPIANGLSTALGGLTGGLTGGTGLLASVLHAGGSVGAPGPTRLVPALAFAAAPRMHQGGWAGLGPDEVPAILQRGERVLSRREAAAHAAGAAGRQAAPVVTIQTRDAESFRQSRTQVAADLARAVAMGRKGM